MTDATATTPRSLVVNLLGTDYRLCCLTAAEWASLPEADRPGDAHLMSDGESRLRLVPLPKR